MTGLNEKKQRSYPLQLKKKVAEEVILGKKGLSEASREYSIPSGTVKYWRNKYGAEIFKKQTKESVSLSPMEKKNEKNVDLAEKVKILEEENLKLRKKLAESDLRTEALNTLIDLAEESYGLTLRKNSGAKQSKD